MSEDAAAHDRYMKALGWSGAMRNVMSLFEETAPDVVTRAEALALLRDIPNPYSVGE